MRRFGNLNFGSVEIFKKNHYIGIQKNISIVEIILKQIRQVLMTL